MTLEAARGQERAQLEHPLGGAALPVRVREQHDVAAVFAHGAGAFLGIELPVQERHRRDLVSPSDLAHQSVHPRLGPEPGRAGGKLRDEEDPETVWSHRRWRRSAGL
jgi:hypothetical protein